MHDMAVFEVPLQCNNGIVQNVGSEKLLNFLR